MLRFLQAHTRIESSLFVPALRLLFLVPSARLTYIHVLPRTRLDIRGRVKVLHGQNKKTEEPPLALFAICALRPASLLEIPQKEVMFRPPSQGGGSHRSGHMVGIQSGQASIQYNNNLANPDPHDFHYPPGSLPV
ncbi:hypothetical protein EVAR_98518_1 [Eumeta japonica]|uniref:Uncharacterized protein n=1 Tax=Eumeta variegata TaxID=151549 RepID=A0A4C1SV39_EUMVA|nr:hypothetical protein EVAR_98518_1 [Eumeta japonica]